MRYTPMHNRCRETKIYLDSKRAQQLISYIFHNAILHRVQHALTSVLKIDASDKGLNSSQLKWHIEARSDVRATGAKMIDGTLFKSTVSGGKNHSSRVFNSQYHLCTTKNFTKLHESSFSRRTRTI